LGAGCRRRRRCRWRLLRGRLRWWRRSSSSSSSGRDGVCGRTVVVVVVRSRRRRRWDGGRVIDAGRGRCRNAVAGRRHCIGVGCRVVVWSTALVVASVVIIVRGGAVVVVADGGGRVDDAGGGGGGSDALWVGRAGHVVKS